jgi:hypothetical protein
MVLDDPKRERQASEQERSKKRGRRRGVRDSVEKVAS